MHIIQTNLLLVVALIFRKYTAISTTNYVNQNSCIGSFSPDIENTVTTGLNQHICDAQNIAVYIIK